MLTFHQRFSDRMQSLFRGSPDAQEGGGSEPLMDIVWQYPAESVWFIKAVMFFGTVWGAAVGCPCLLFLMVHWTQCEPCNRPLRYWLLVHSLLQLVQTPGRCVFYKQLLRVEQRNDDVLLCIRQMTTSFAWKASKVLSIGTYGWFVLGVVWILNSTHCTPCPGLYRLTLAVIITTVLRLFLTLACFYHSFPRREPQPSSPKPTGAAQEDLNMLGQETFVEDSSEDSKDVPSCAVCLSDFAGGDTLRSLPCGHRFHKRCIDKWLVRNKVCPLCLRDINPDKGKCCKKVE